MCTFLSQMGDSNFGSCVWTASGAASWTWTQPSHFHPFYPERIGLHLVNKLVHGEKKYIFKVKTLDEDEKVSSPVV